MHLMIVADDGWSRWKGILNQCLFAMMIAVAQGAFRHLISNPAPSEARDPSAPSAGRPFRRPEDVNQKMRNPNPSKQTNPN